MALAQSASVARRGHHHTFPDTPENQAAYPQRRGLGFPLRAIKRTLGMERLTCKTSEMVRKELWAHLLGYKLARKVSAQAAWERGFCPRHISFAGTVQMLEVFRELLLPRINEW